MTTKVYKEGYQVIVDEELKPYNKYTTATFCSFGFDGEICWIKELADTEEYIYNDLCTNMTTKSGQPIGNKEAVEAYLLKIIGDPNSSTPDSEYKFNYTSSNETSTETVDIIIDGDFRLAVKFRSRVLANGQVIFRGNNCRVGVNGVGGIRYNNWVGITTDTDSGLIKTTNIYVLNVNKTGTLVEIWLDGILIDSFTDTEPLFRIDYLARYGNSYFEGDIYWFRINDEYYFMNEGSGTTITGSNGTVFNITTTGGVINDMWELI